MRAEQAKEHSQDVADQEYDQYLADIPDSDRLKIISEESIEFSRPVFIPNRPATKYKIYILVAACLICLCILLGSFWRFL